MKILISGSGLLGKFLFKHIKRNFISKLIALRNSDISIFKNEFNKLQEGDIFVDSMDPNDINIKFDKQIHEKAKLFRDYALKNSKRISYIYISTSNLYKTSLEKIYEFSEIKTNLSPYLKMKLDTEEKIKKLCLSNYGILRLVNIWSTISKDSFLGDLLFAKKNELFIEPRLNDNLVISYANIIDICKIIEFIIISKKYGIINVSTNSYNSRENLKSIVNKKITKAISKNLGYRIYSNVIDWELIIGKKKELF